MRSAWTIALKDLTQLSRDRMGMFFILAFPIAMAFFFGLIGVSMQSDSAQLAVALVDEDDSPASRIFATEFTRQGRIAVERLARDEAIERVRRGSLVGVVALPEGFGERAGLFWHSPPRIELGIDPSRRAEAGMLEGLVFQTMGKVTFARFSDPEAFRPLVAQARRDLEADEDIPSSVKTLLSGLLGVSEQLVDAAAAERREQASQSPLSNENSEFEFRFVEFDRLDVTRRAPNAELLAKIRSPWDISFPQAMLWAILGCVAGFAISIVRERTRGTWLRLRLAPVAQATVIGGKALACFLAVVGVVTLLTVIGLAVGLRPRSPGLLVLAALSNAICFVGLMMALSVIGKTEESVSGAVWGIGILMSMFGGGMVPLAFLPSFMKTLSHLSPIKWGILALEGAIWRGFSLTEMLVPCGILCAIGAVGFTLGVRMLRRI